jgi:hypothetical protein
MTTLPPSLTNQEAPVGSLPGLLSRSAAADGTGNRGEGTGVPRILIHSVQGLTGMHARDFVCFGRSENRSEGPGGIWRRRVERPLCLCSRRHRGQPTACALLTLGPIGSRTIPEGRSLGCKVAQMPVDADWSGHTGRPQVEILRTGETASRLYRLSLNRTKYIENLSVGSPAAMPD